MDNEQSTQNRVPIQPFLEQVFGEELNSQEGIVAAVEYMQENREQFNQMFKEYVNQYRQNMM